MPDEDELTPEQDNEPECLKARIVELEGILTQRDAGLEKANNRITELEQSANDASDRITSLNNNLAQAVASYKTLVIYSNPEIMEELICGESIEEINTSLEKARNLINRVKDGLEQETTRVRVPTGSPPRVPVDMSALSPGEKIRYGIAQGGKK